VYGWNWCINLHDALWAGSRDWSCHHPYLTLLEASRPWQWLSLSIVSGRHILKLWHVLTGCQIFVHLFQYVCDVFLDETGISKKVIQ
jgi:hypothetical protein